METKEELQQMEQDGVISVVDKPTEWCAPKVVNPKTMTKFVYAWTSHNLIATYNLKTILYPLPSSSHD
jgi:hypothetical protein